MTKNMKVIGIATAAVWAISSMAVFAADKEYSYLAGRAKGSQYASTDERTGVENYGFRKGGNLETILENGEITQEEFDAIKAEIEARHEEKNFSNGKKGKSGFGKGKVKSESNMGTDTEA